MGSVAQMSVIWFPERLRPLCTAIGSTANPLGVTLGFVLGPWLAPSAGDYFCLLAWELAFAGVPWLCVMIYWPSAPSVLPSAAAVAALDTTDATSNFRQGLVLALRNKHYGALMLAAGILGGAGTGLNGVLYDILSPAGYSDRFIGYLGFARSLMLNCGSVSSGRAASSKFLRRRFKLLILVGLCLVEIAGVAWAFACTSRRSPFLITCVICCMGLGQGVALPFFFELGAELTFPVPAGTSGGILSFVWNAVAMVMIALPAGLGVNMNWVYLGLIGSSITLVGYVRERYSRPSDSVVENCVTD